MRPSSSPQYLRRVSDVITRGTALLGPETAGVRGRARGLGRCAGRDRVSSGAGALQLTLAGARRRPGDEVIVPAFTAVPTASAVARSGPSPCSSTSIPDTAALDTAAVDAARTERTRAVVVVHLYGRPAPLPLTDLPIVEDAAQAAGALERHDASAAVTYSFYPTKNLGGIGDGGAIVSADTDLLERVRRLRVHGMTQQYVHEAVSQNFRMSELEAAWLRLGLPLLDAANERRRQIVARYHEAAPGVRWHARHERHVHHLCVARFERRDHVRELLGAAGVGTAVHYPLALTQQPAYRHLTRAACPEAEAWAASCVSLPCFPQLSDDEVEHVARALADVADRVGLVTGARA
jgi:dTDP-4-amino-4,6-dideoxygalactose transaminase